MGRAVRKLARSKPPHAAKRLLRAIRNLIDRTALKVVIVCTVALGLLGSVALHAINHAEERRTYSSLLSNNEWAVAQLELELIRFLASLDGYVSNAGHVLRDDLILRFDILWSRVRHLAVGPGTAEFRKVSGAHVLLSDMQATLKKVDARVQALKPGDWQAHKQIRDALFPFVRPAHAFTLQLHNGDHFKAITNRLRGNRETGLIIQGVIALIAVLIVLMLVREVRISHREAAHARTARDAAEAANRAKSVFLANMSHELRTPLNAIIGFSEMQLSETFGPMPKRYKAYAHHVHDSARHLLSVVNNVLDMAKYDAGKTTLFLEPFDPADALAGCVRALGPAARQKSLRLTLAGPPRPVELVGDAQRFRQIALNLLSNAVKFTPDNGWVEVELWLDAGHLHLRVTDNGPGIPGDFIDHITEPFVQVDQRLARAYEGTGLGLALVNAFVGLHGGALQISNREGGGARFEVVLPNARHLDTASEEIGQGPDAADRHVAAAP